MTQNPDHPDPKHPGEPSDLPESLLSDLRQAYHAEEVQPPSRVDDAVFQAVADHFAQPATGVHPGAAELKPGVLAWITRRPLRSAGLGGALIAASLALAVLIVSPGRQSMPSDGRSVAMDSFMAEEGHPAPPSPFAEIEMESDRDDARRVGRSAERLREPLPASPKDLVADQMLELAPRAALRSIVKGDVNGDGIITIADALLLARMVEAAGGTLDEPRFDMLGNGTVSRADADAIARMVVRLAPSPAPNPNPEGAS
ncbi:MAG: dockerin type I repeat-containing protein [Phycisphaerales bacterium]